MNLTTIDWFIVFGMLTILTFGAWYTKRYTRSVADFLSANRCAGRYVLSVSEGIVTLGAITIIARFQMYYKAGFTASWWQMIELPIGIIIAVTGWVIYRYRQTRAFTLAQFFEIRYSKSFRIFSGLLAFVAGIINYGIFPAVGAKFFIYFCALPQSFTLPLLGIEVSTYVAMMFSLLMIALAFTFMGGQIAVLVTDFIQGMFSNLVFLAVILVIFYKMRWSTIIEGLSFAPEGKSMLNPFDTKAIPDFNIWFFLIAAFVRFYACMAWQGRQAYFCSAKNAHEAKMAQVIGQWRGIALLLMLLMLPVASYVVMHHPAYAEMASTVNSDLSAIQANNVVETEQIRSQMTVPFVLVHLLPKGLVGAFCAMMLAAFLSTNDTYLHSWGSIFVQDVIMPFRKKSFTPKQHMWMLRGSIIGVAVFVFAYSMLFRQTEDILMYFAITGAVFVGGIGSAIIGGLYWKRGSTAAAWSATIVGSILAVSGIVVHQVWPTMHEGARFPIHSQYLSVIAMSTAIIVYILVSLFGKRTDFNMDKMLHRGKYAEKIEGQVAVSKPARGLKALITPEFSLGDKFIYISVIVWAVSWFSLCIWGTVYNKIFGISPDWWPKFWRFYIYLSFVIGIVTTIWLVIGGLVDLKAMLAKLSTVKRNHLDDGMVIDHHNAGEELENGNNLSE